MSSFYLQQSWDHTLFEKFMEMLYRPVITLQTMTEKSSNKRIQQNISIPLILEWLNNLLGLQLTRIEELGSGAIYCQLFEMIHPGSIPMHKVNWQAKHQYEFVNNLRLLQDAFAKLKISRPLQPLKLAKAKIPDNFDLIVWLRSYFLNNKQETQCTFDNSLRERADFSFAHSKIIPKSFGVGVSHESLKCSCCMQKRRQKKLLRMVEASYVKFQMINEVLQSNEQIEEKLFLINEIMLLALPRQ